MNMIYSNFTTVGVSQNLELPPKSMEKPWFITILPRDPSSPSTCLDQGSSAHHKVEMVEDRLDLLKILALRNWDGHGWIM